MRFRGLLQAFQARPVARAAFLATRLSPAPVFRAALFADLMAFVVLDVLRLAFFMIPPVPRFVQLGSFLHLRQARFGLPQVAAAPKANPAGGGSSGVQSSAGTWGSERERACQV